jgi:hypothetical protein
LKDYGDPYLRWGQGRNVLLNEKPLARELVLEPHKPWYSRIVEPLRSWCQEELISPPKARRATPKSGPDADVMGVDSESQLSS